MQFGKVPFSGTELKNEPQMSQAQAGFPDQRGAQLRSSHGPEQAL